MARMIGGTKSGIWWLAGMLCALLCGSARAAEPAKQAQAAYGIMPQADRAFIIAPRPPDAPPDAVQQAEKLIDAYLEEQNPPPAPADLEQKLAGLIKDLGSDEWARREEASQAIVKIGRPALPALRETVANSKDAEVIQRAKEAIAKIGGSGSALESLRALGAAGQTAVQARIAQEKKTIAEQAGAAAEAELAGDKAQAEKLRADAKAAQARAGHLNKLKELLAQAQPAAPRPGPGEMIALYGVRAVE